MTRAGVAGLALRAYPPAARAAHGEEMLATLLDASAGSRRRFAREIVDLVRFGMRARAAERARAGAGRLIADGFCLAAIWVMALDLSTLVAQRERGMHDTLLAAPSIALLAGSLTAALIGCERLAGAGALAWTALRLPELLDLHPGLAGLVPEVLPIVCFALLVLAPRRRGPDPRRLAWLVVPAALVLVTGPGRENPLLVAAVLLAVVAATTLAVATLPADPRLAIAGAVPLSNVAIGVVTSHSHTPIAIWLCLAAAPAVLLVALARGAQNTGTSV